MSETAAEKPAFRDALKWHRCLIPADGIYEWKKPGLKRTSVQLRSCDRLGIRVCGTMGPVARPEKHILETCTILTTRPNSLVADVHDRMPAILDPDDYERWLEPGITKSEVVLDCLARAL